MSQTKSFATSGESCSLTANVSRERLTISTFSPDIPAPTLPQVGAAGLPARERAVMSGAERVERLIENEPRAFGIDPAVALGRRLRIGLGLLRDRLRLSRDRLRFGPGRDRLRLGRVRLRLRDRR